MVNLTQLILLVHILSAIWLAVGAFAGAVARAQARRSDDLAGRVAALRIGWRLASIFSVPGAIAAGLTGLSVVTPVGYAFSGPRVGWIHASIGLWALLLATQLFYLTPRLKKTLAAAEASLAAGAPTEDFTRLAAAKLPGILADVVALGIVVLVALMVLRPF